VTVKGMSATLATAVGANIARALKATAVAVVAAAVTVARPQRTGGRVSRVKQAGAHPAA
jgi:biopolymer transport protein ExbB/TolQ